MPPGVTLAQDLTPPKLASEPSGEPRFSDRLFHWEGLAPPPEDNAEPYSLQWFLAIEHQRHTRHARWIGSLLEFAKHAGETLLGLGNCLGTDWLQYARHGARVIACSPLAAELALIRRNFELRGLEGRFMHSDPTHLPLASSSVDVACISGLLHEWAEPDAIVTEVFRVLKPGGKVLAVVPHLYSVDYWRQWWPWNRGMRSPLLGSPWRSNHSFHPELVHFSRRSLRRLFTAFADHRIHQRQLLRSEVPFLWRWVPRRWLERVMGRFLILKAFKPVIQTVPQLAAA